MKKKSLLFIASCLCVAMNLKAQLFITVGGGYGFPYGKELMTTNEESDSLHDHITGVYGSYGKGIMPQLTIGYQLCENGSVEISGQYLIGTATKGEYTDVPATGYYYSGKQEITSSAIRVGIGGRFHFGENALRPYMRANVMLGFANRVKIHSEYTGTNPWTTSSSEVMEVEFDGGIALGFSSGIGATYTVSPLIGIYGELFLITQSWAPTHGEITKYTYNGVDQLPTMTVNDKEVNFYDEIDESNTTPPNQNEPGKDLKTDFPMHSWGLNIGVRLSFGGGE